jgi:hypothetical protein
MHLTLTKKLLLFFFILKSFDARSRCAPRTSKVLEVVALGMTKKHKEKE